MSIKRLSLENAQNLISKYNAEIKALDFQAGEIKKVLKELGTHHAKLKKAADKKAAAAAKKAAAAAKKKAAAAAKKKAAAAKKKAAAAKKKAAAAAKKKPKAAAKKKAGRPAAKKKAGRPAKKKAGRPAKKKAGRPAAKKKAGRPAAKKKAGRPAATKKAGRPAAKKKAGRPAKKKVAAKSKASGGKRGRKMSYSDWDMLVMNALKGQSSPVRTSTLLDKGQAWAKKSSGNSTEKYVRAKVAASLQKLVNKTKEVKKVPAEGRGYSYLMA